MTTKTKKRELRVAYRGVPFCRTTAADYTYVVVSVPGGETMTPELKSCPFCGDVPKLSTWKDSLDDDHFGVFCENRDCPVRPELRVENFDAAQTVEAWNRRSSTPTRAATDAEIGEHHWRDGLRFKRLENGTVRIRRDADVIATIPAAEWESIVREVEPANRANGTALDGRLIASEVADSSPPSSTTATPDAWAIINDGAVVGVRFVQSEAEYAAAGWNNASVEPLYRALPSSRALSEETANLVASLIHEWQWERPQREPVEVAREILDRLTGAPK
jgi:hypothetical protein